MVPSGTRLQVACPAVGHPRVSRTRVYTVLLTACGSCPLSRRDGGAGDTVAHGDLHLGTPLLLEAALLFHGRVLRPAGAAVLHQQGQYLGRLVLDAAAGPEEHGAPRESRTLDSWVGGDLHILPSLTNPCWACHKGIQILCVPNPGVANPGDRGKPEREGKWVMQAGHEKNSTSEMKNSKCPWGSR